MARKEFIQMCASLESLTLQEMIGVVFMQPQDQQFGRYLHFGIRKAVTD